MFHHSQSVSSQSSAAGPTRSESSSTSESKRRQRFQLPGAGNSSSSPLGPGSSQARTTFHFKLVLLGDTAVGKSCLVVRFARNEFFEYQEPTIGAAFLTQSLGVSDAIVRFEIWDTAGAERYRSLAPMYYRGAAAAVIVYDITSQESFDGAKAWVNELLSLNSSEVLIALAGNKCDLEQDRAVDAEVGRLYAENNNLLFFETSAKTGQNVFELFREIAERLPKRVRDRTPDVSNSGFQLNSRPRGGSTSSTASQTSSFKGCC